MNNELDVINVGVFGHIDHGKTTLLKKLTGKWADTHSEEMKRGITIKLGYADFTLYKDGNDYNTNKGTPIRHISFIDSPGHEMLMATMLSGASMVDVAILVVAANEGIKAQTLEHFMALKAKKVPNLIIVQNKIDLVTKEQAKQNYLEIKKMIKGSYENSPIIPVSAQQDVNIKLIYKTLAEIPIQNRKLGDNPRFIIARSFDVNRPGTTIENLHGTVLGGTLTQGTLKVGDEIEIKPGIVIKEANQYNYKTINTKVKKLFVGNKEVKELTPGGSMSIETNLDMALGKSDALSGCIAAPIGSLPEIATNLKINHQLFPEIAGEIKVDPIKPSESLLLSINTSMTIGIVKRINKKELELSLKVPIVPSEGANVAISRNINNHWRLIGYGEIL
ncbi:translation initiation factor IF-2 subunit gamma [Candidatus Pacearchaeota archaeon CG10_big_fil_rev_8_21_14_0_10_31_24]|nr:MAG: translation initiation factor IF-2 subunit gamma [Candidatus Pacearchaeota archaeon CG10_big_fil_rev_8_21_14_0_10_31_24]